MSNSSRPHGLQPTRHLRPSGFPGKSTTPLAESKELKGLLIKMKEEGDKARLKLNIQKIKIMASGPIASCQIEGETMETVADFILGGSKSLEMVTEAMKLKDPCSLEKKL